MLQEKYCKEENEKVGLALYRWSVIRQGSYSAQDYTHPPGVSAKMVNMALTSGKPRTLETCMFFSVLLSIFNPFEDIPVQYERWYRSCTWWQALGMVMLGKGCLVLCSWQN